MTSFDAIVIGAGHNGLTAAAMLAKRGYRTAIFEAASAAGGAARRGELQQGFAFSPLAHRADRVHNDVVRELELTRFGLKRRASPMADIALSEGGNHLVLRGLYGERIDGDISQHELQNWQALRSQLFLHAGILRKIFEHVPPPLEQPSWRDAMRLAKTGLSLRLLGAAQMREFMRMILMPVADVANEQLADDRLKGLLAFDATLGIHLGPRSPTSLLGLYYRLASSLGAGSAAGTMIAGGAAALIEAMEKSARNSGAQIFVNSPVGRILVERGKSAGIVLANGEEFRAPLVISAINPATTFLNLVGPAHLDTGFVRAIRNIRMKGDASKLNLVLDRVPAISGLAADDFSGRFVIAPTSDHVERAFNPAKYGELPQEPVMEIMLPSLSDPDAAKSGACAMSVILQHTPYDLRQGWDRGKPLLLESALTLLERHIPGLRKSIIASELLSPPDIEARYLMPGGHWHHGELQADQMAMMRPVHAASRYATPIEGLYLCGAGSHPGGGLTGLPGLNAARTILRGA